MSGSTGDLMSRTRGNGTNPQNLVSSGVVAQPRSHRPPRRLVVFPWLRCAQILCGLRWLHKRRGAPPKVLFPRSCDTSEYHFLSSTASGRPTAPPCSRGRSATMSSYQGWYDRRPHPETYQGRQGQQSRPQAGQSLPQINCE
jgi:hypothetical protein